MGEGERERWVGMITSTLCAARLFQSTEQSSFHLSYGQPWRILLPSTVRGRCLAAPAVALSPRNRRSEIATAKICMTSDNMSCNECLFRRVHSTARGGRRGGPDRVLGRGGRRDGGLIKTIWDGIIADEVSSDIDPYLRDSYTTRCAARYTDR